METISTLGSHSALDVCEGAKRHNFKTLVVCKKGREKPYDKYYKTRVRNGVIIGVVDSTIILDEFRQIANKDVQKKLEDTVFIPNRSFAVYVGYDTIERDINFPIFGNKFLLRAEERDAPKNQFYLLEKAGIKMPKVYRKPEDIDSLAIVKVSEAKRRYERAFFIVSSYDDYMEKASQMLSSGAVREEDLRNARIEEFVIGAQFNFNFFYSKVNEELELMGLDTRRQVDLDGFLHLPADVQLEALKHKRPKNIEIGHFACTIRESFLEKVFEIGERFVSAVEKEYGKFAGPFALQGFVDGEEEIKIFDVSLRMPGSPGTRFTPYCYYLHRRGCGVGERIAVEIREAINKEMLDEVTT